MKQKFIPFLLLLFVPMQSSFGGPVSLGIRASTNYSNLGKVKSSANNQSIDADLKQSFAFGAWARIKLPGAGTFLQTGATYSKRKSEYKIDDTETGEYTSEVIEVPVYFGVNFLKFFSFGFGPSVAMPLKSVYDSNKLNDKVNTDYGYTVNAAAFLNVRILSFGVSVSGQLPIFDEGTKDVGNISIDPSTRVVSVGLSYAIF